MSSKTELLEDGIAQGRRQLAERLEEMLWPERFPPGHERHDSDHVYWSGGEHEYESAFQWKADTIEWVAMEVEAALK